MSFSSFIKEHLRPLWVKVLGALGALLLLYKIHDVLSGWLAHWIGGHITVQGGAGIVGGWVVGTIAALLLLLVLSMPFLAYALVSLYRAKGGDERTKILLKTFHRTTQAVDLISKQLFPGASLPVKKVLSCKQIYTIFDGGDCHFKEILVVCAKDKPIHFIEKGFDAEPEADPVEFPDEIDLKITPRKSVSYLISKNEPRSIGVVVFFLPLIKPDGQDERKLETVYYWKGLMKKLLSKKEEPFTYQVKSVESVPQIEYQFWIKPNLGRLVCSHLGESLGEDNETLDEAGPDEKGFQGWIYKGRDIPPDHITRLRLELKGR